MKNALKATIFGVVLASSVGSVMAQTTDIQVTAKIPELLTIGEIPSVFLELKDENVTKEVSFNISENAGTIKVLFTGSNGTGDDGSFLLKKGDETVKFSLEYQPGVGYFETIKNSEEKTLSNQGNNHSIKFKVAHADWKDNSTGQYNETLTLTMSHE